jgi:hypothetical protein
MGNFCFTNRSLQFSDFTHKPLGKFICPSSLLFLILPSPSFFFPHRQQLHPNLLSFLSPFAQLQAGRGQGRPEWRAALGQRAGHGRRRRTGGARLGRAPRGQAGVGARLGSRPRWREQAWRRAGVSQAGDRLVIMIGGVGM